MNHLVSLRKHMFLDENISKLVYKNIMNNNKRNVVLSSTTSLKGGVKSSYNNNTDPIFYPFQKDKLFWCFYIIIEGIDKYNLSRQHFYQIEKEYKIQLISLLRSNKAIIKNYKMKRNDIENELLNENTISLSTFLLLCSLKKINIICVHRHIYYEVIDNTDIGIEKSIPVIEYNETKGYGIYMNKTDSIIENIKRDKLFIQDINKPLKAITTYKLEHLKEISNKLDIPLFNDIGKKKNKKDLYEDIRKKLI